MLYTFLNLNRRKNVFYIMQEFIIFWRLCLLDPHQGFAQEPLTGGFNAAPRPLSSTAPPPPVQKFLDLPLGALLGRVLLRIVLNIITYNAIYM
jgi:hypothetical protein